jgi:putative effector of murein hydrolase
MEPIAGTPLPPGYYFYSNQFPAMMSTLSPTYTIVAVPVFMNHLMQQNGKNITVVTVNGTLEGLLSGIAVDHLQLTVNGVNHHIRYPHIVYFKEA